MPTLSWPCFQKYAFDKQIDRQTQTGTTSYFIANSHILIVPFRSSTTLHYNVHEYYHQVQVGMPTSSWSCFENTCERQTDKLTDRQTQRRTTFNFMANFLEVLKLFFDGDVRSEA